MQKLSWRLELLPVPFAEGEEEEPDAVYANDHRYESEEAAVVHALALREILRATGQRVSAANSSP